MRAVWLVLFASAATPAAADALLSQALANGGAWSPDDWAYVSTTRVNAGGSNVVSDAWSRATSGSRASAPTRNVRVVTYDPSKPEGQRQVVLSDDSATPPAVNKSLNIRKGRNDTFIHSDESDRLPSYDDMRQMVSSDAAKIGDTVATATYRFTTPLKNIRHIGSANIDVVGDSGGRIMLSGTAVVQKAGPGAPYVKSVIVYLPTGDRGRGNAAGKIRQLSMGFRFAPDPTRQVELLRAFGFDSQFQALGLVSVGASVLNRVDGYRFVGAK